MKRIYRIAHMPGFAGDWEPVPPASIDCAPWNGGGLPPPAEARVAFDGEALHVRLKAWERNPAVVTRAPNGPVWEDSCIEFFLNPAPERDGRYLNFELNAEGVMLLGFGAGREGRRLIDFRPEDFRISADVPPYGAAAWDRPFYAVRFVIPVGFLEGLYGKLELRPGAVMAGNFQKCGERTGSPHYGVWNPIATEEPDFHQPHYFGLIILGL